MSAARGCIAAGIAALAAALALFGWFTAVPGRPVPLLAALPWVLALGALTAFGAAAFVSVRAMARPRAAGGVAGRVGAAVLASLVGLGAVVLTDPSFPFGGSVEARLPSSDGTTYLYRGGLFCVRSLWRAPSGAWFATEVASGWTCDGEATLAQSDGAITPIDPRTGAELARATWLEGIGEHLDWRPH